MNLKRENIHKVYKSNAKIRVAVKMTLKRFTTKYELVRDGKKANFLVGLQQLFDPNHQH